MIWAKDLFKKENIFSPNEAYDEAPFEDKEDVANTPMFVKVSDLRSGVLKRKEEAKKEAKKNSRFWINVGKQFWELEIEEKAKAFDELTEALELKE